MIKKIIISGIFVGCSLLSVAQSNIPEGDDTPPEFERAYNQQLSKKEVGTELGSNSNGTIVFDDSTYIRRLYSLPTSMELVFNQLVKQQIEYYAGRRKSQVSYMLGEGNYYFPIIEAALDKENLPLELKYLPIIESALNPVARSRAGALGLWQFMPSTGKMYDLEVNSLVDERLDPQKSSEAAAKHLKDLYDKYGDWNLVIAAYNCGAGNVDKAIRRSGGLSDYWTIYPYLPRETRGYVPIFIAATYIMNYYREHGISPAEGTKPAPVDSVVINQRLHLQQVADVLNMPVDDIRRYNPQFKKDIIPGDYKSYALNLPMDKVLAFVDKQNDIYTYKTDELLTHRKVAGPELAAGSSTGSSTETKVITYQVKRGDTLSEIAQRYGVSLSRLKSWNGMTSNSLSAGRRLKIYRSVPAAPQTIASAPQQASEGVSSIEGKYTGKPIEGVTTGSSTAEAKTVISYYTVRRGDTWSKVAQKNNASIADIKTWNNIKNNRLIAGKQLKIQKIEYVEVAPEEPKLAEPRLAYVEMDSTFTINIFDDYLKNADESLPRINVAKEDDTPARRQTDDTRLIYHKVRIGETISQIAARYNVSLEEIKSWNDLSSNVAKTGQRLLIHLPGDDADNDNAPRKKTASLANE